MFAKVGSVTADPRGARAGIISKIDEKISLNDLLEMSKNNKLSEFLNNFEKITDYVKKDFISDKQYESYFNSNDLS